MQGQARFDLYQKLLALGFATVQAVGQLSLLRPYVDDWSVLWLYSSTVTLVAGSSMLVFVRRASSVVRNSMQWQREHGSLCQSIG